MMDKEERLFWLKLALDRRSEGHTYAMVNGAANAPATVLLATIDHKNYVERMAGRRLKIITWDNFDPRRISGPLLIDHAALSSIIRDALALLRAARSENYILQDEVRMLKGMKHEH